MKTTMLAAFFLSCVFAWAGGDPNPAEYAIDVHVTASRMDANFQDQELSVVIDGKKYELQSAPIGRLLATGDYKAKLIHDEHKDGYDSVKVYEFLFPDKKTRAFRVVGQIE